MADTIIENPILNSPFREPERHWRFTDEGITNEIVNSRRQSTSFVARVFCAASTKQSSRRKCQSANGLRSGGTSLQLRYLWAWAVCTATAERSIDPPAAANDEST